MEIKSIGFALDPSNIPSFLLDWEVTKKCNLDCSYCDIGIDGGHDNSMSHPNINDCLNSIDFMYEYVSLYMSNKKSTQRKVVLNVYGGESLFHPNIVEILTAAREKYKPYADLWELTITTTTNAVVNKSIWKKIIPLIDEFTVSYHAENLPKQEQLFFDNLLKLKDNNKRVKCVVMMHNNPQLWEKSIGALEFCKNNGIKSVAKSFDNYDKPNLNYTNEQFNHLKSIWLQGTNTKNIEQSTKMLESIGNKKEIISICEGRACCGGRKISLNNDLRSSVNFVSRQGFLGWHCSVNWFFLFVQQASGRIYTNKDCRTSLNSKVEPLGTLENTQKILLELKTQFDNKTLPVIKCIKSTCLCGYCAPKAEKLDDFKDLITRNVITDVIKYE
jgi:MoaA/NifB/PqqE/SkfB family radical SAM enzyme